MKIKEVINRIDEIDEKLKNKKYQEIIFDNVCKKKYKNTSQKYRLIAKLLNEEYSLYGISEVTVWRLLKIKNASPETYNRIKEGDIRIKTAYEKIFNKPKQDNNNNNEKFLSEIKETSDFESIFEQISLYNECLEKWKTHFLKEPSKETLLKIDSELYKMRKLLYKILAYYDDFE